MNNAEFVQRLADLAFGKKDFHFHDSFNERPLFVSVSNSHYGKPSSVIIEFEGSPAKFPIYMGGLQLHPVSRILVINNKVLKYSEKQVTACQLIEKFLSVRGYIPLKVRNNTAGFFSRMS